MLSKAAIKVSSSAIRRPLIHHHQQQRQWYTTAVASSSSSSSSTWLYNSLSFAAPEESEQAYIRSMIPNKYHHHLLQPAHTINDFSHIPSSIRTLQDVLLSQQACIVTTIEQPHTIVAVNDAWTATCGYTQDEVHHQSISSILHGPLTNNSIIRSTMERVRDNVINNKNNTNNNSNTAHTSSATTTSEDMYIVNYKKDASSFINHVTISKIILSYDQPNIQFLLGIVQPTLHDDVPLRMVI